MNRQRVASRRGTWLAADRLDVGRPANLEGLYAPYHFEQASIRALRRSIDEAGHIRQAHFHRVGRRSLRLLGRGVAESAAGRAHVPEIAAHQVVLAGIVGQDRR